MKTAISLPDTLFQEAERFAQQHGLSRSELYASALQSYLKARATTTITDALNAVYSTEDSRVGPALAYAQTHALKKEG